MLPESLQQNLKQFEKRLFMVESIVFVCGGLLGVFVSFLLLFVSDRFWDTPVLLRFILTLAGCVVFGFIGAWWARYWLVRRRDSRSLAKLVQKGMSGIGDRLLGAVELAEGKDLPPNVSPALCQAAIDQVAEQMKEYDFKGAVENRRSRMLSLSMVLCSVLIAGLAVFVGPAFRNSLKRWRSPAADVPRYTFVSIEAMPDRLVVPHGEEFPIRIQLSKSTAWEPGTAACQFEDQPEIRAELVSGMAEFNLPGQVSEGDLLIRLGDVRRRIRILPVFRPELVEMVAKIEMPEYLGYSDYEKKIEAGTCEVLDGSTILLEGRASRELRSVLFASGTDEVALEPRGPVFATGVLDPAAMSNCVFRWEDVYGLQTRQPYTVRCIKVEDMAPVVECRGIGRSVAILEDEVIKIEAAANDDFGLRDLRLSWSLSGEKGETQEALLAEGGRKQKDLDGSYLFSPIADAVPEETVVTVFASARDYRPGAKPGISVAHRIYVLSKATHAKLMQDLMERVQTRIEDLARAEKDLQRNNEDLAASEPEDLKSRESAETTRKNEYRERENARKLDDISREMQDLMKELMRNSDIDTEAVKSWAEMIDQMQKLSQNEMSEAVESMRKASSDPSNREENLKDAIAAEQKIIEQLKNSAGKMGKTLEDMMARNFVNRLLQLSQLQGQVGETAKSILPKTVGLSKDDLPAEIAKLVTGQEEKQLQIKKEAGYIYDDLGGYFNRTRKPVYDEIRKDMAAKETPEEMQAMRDRIVQNLGVSVIEGSGKWSAQFKEWAEMLSKNSDQEGQDGEPQELSAEDLEVLIELLRLRQGEEQLREQTRVLEERKDGNLNYSSDARKLARKQKELDSATLDLQRKVKNKKLKQLLEKIDGEMLNAEVHLKRPQTDADTVAIQTEIIELLSMGVNQSSGGQMGGMSMMLMQMMGMGQGGGSYAGGTTDQDNLAFKGEDSEQEFESRTVDTAGGAVEEWSEEFKDALDAYYRALEAN